MLLGHTIGNVFQMDKHDYPKSEDMMYFILDTCIRKILEVFAKNNGNILTIDIDRNRTDEYVYI